MLARRTSPTNIGMGMLSALAAHDLGYLTTDAMLGRLDATTRSLESLERYQGHFLNWYDTETRAPLQAALRLDRRQRQPRGLVDCAGSRSARARREAADARPAARGTGRHGLSAGGRFVVSQHRHCRPRNPHRHQSPGARAGHDRPGRGWLRQQRRGNRCNSGVCAATRRCGARGSEATRTLDSPARSGIGARPCSTRPHTSPTNRRWMLTAVRALAGRMSALADGMQFNFLYDRRRRIFSIGYRLPDADGTGRLDASFYDLLASEARLASFVAIAKGDVPQHHWFHLGRLVTNVDGRATLMSWGGTMFEYLMPQLLMRNFPGTLLDQSCRASVRRQIDYGKRRGVPWGISESAYAFTDREGNYQYRAFGVPGLGLRRGLVDDLVISPYATALASLVNPSAAAENFERLAELGLEGRFGFYEALDYNPRSRDLDAAPDTVAASRRRACLLRASPGHVARRACQRRLPRRLRRALPRRPANSGDRAAAPGARAARGHPVGAAAGGGRHRAAVAPGVCVTAVPLAAYQDRAHALPVEWTSHHRSHQRRWRLLHVARHRGDASPGGSDVRCRRPFHLPARSLVQSRLVRHPSAGRRRSRPVRHRVRSRQDDVPASRRRHRDAARDHDVVGRRCARCGG